MTIRSRAGLAHCPERDFLFGRQSIKSLLVEFAIGEEARGTLREAFSKFPVP